MMTTAELIALLSEYPPETPVVDGRGYSLRHIGELPLDDWSTATLNDDNSETPGTIIAVTIGPRF